MKLWNLVLAIRRLADKSFTAGSERGTDSSNGDDLVRSVSGHTSVVNSAEWSPDARFLISGGRDGTLRYVRSKFRCPPKWPVRASKDRCLI